MVWYEWEEDDYPMCPLCKRSTPTFRPYKKGILRIEKINLPKGKVPAIGKCMWGCTFNSIVPLSWEGNKLSDPNNILKDYNEDEN